MSKVVFNRVFKQAVKENRFDEVIALLRQNIDIDPTGNNGFALVWASQNNRVDLVDILLQNRYTHNTRNADGIICEAFHRACNEGNSVIVERLLFSTHVDPSIGNNIAFRNMYGHGFIDLAHQIANDRRVELTDYDYHEALRIAATNGHIEAVERLVEDEKAHIDNVSYTYWYHLVDNTAYAGHYDIAKLLLSIKDLDFYELENVLVSAVLSGYIDIVDWLLTNKFSMDNPVSSNVITESSITSTSARYDIFNRLLEHPYLDVSEDIDFTLAFFRSYTDILERIMRDPRISFIPVSYTHLRAHETG
jgi:ankyrin repeat protein